ncbi:hypothetical protein CGJ42_24340, partial [Vibrio parahaemolyticus]|uniref:hypothetical protein n=1 Tax=Vibrio parahaemolyticus TaxID=670 RepID=UPI001167B9B8
FLAAAVFSLVLSCKVLINVSKDSTDNQILSFINAIQALCLTTIISLISYQGQGDIQELFIDMFECMLIYTACIAIYHSRIRWNQQQGIKEIV